MVASANGRHAAHLLAPPTAVPVPGAMCVSLGGMPASPAPTLWLRLPIARWVPGTRHSETVPLGSGENRLIPPAPTRKPSQFRSNDGEECFRTPCVMVMDDHVPFAPSPLLRTDWERAPDRVQYDGAFGRYPR